MAWRRRIGRESKRREEMRGREKKKRRERREKRMKKKRRGVEMKESDRNDI